jgi:hypothetical protein
MKTFIIDIASGSIVGVAQAAATLVEGQIAVTSAADLENESLATLTVIYNAATGESKTKFKISKSDAIAKVMAALEALNVPTLPQIEAASTGTVETTGDEQNLAKLDDKTETKIAKTEAKPTKAPKEPSKLQKMASVFRTAMSEDGKPKHFTIAELVELCGTTEDRTHQYISILKNPKDRFVMNIAKTVEKTYYLIPTK